MDEARKPLRVLFVGSSGFGLRCAKAVSELAEVRICGVLTNPRRFAISYAEDGVENVLHGDFEPFARDLGVPLHVMTGKMSDPVVDDFVASVRPDLLLVVGWYHMVPSRIRERAPAFGLHASLLPDYSGGAPLVWAIINGERETGITLFRFDDGLFLFDQLF